MSQSSKGVKATIQTNEHLPMHVKNDCPEGTTFCVPTRKRPCRPIELLADEINSVLKLVMLASHPPY